MKPPAFFSFDSAKQAANIEKHGTDFDPVASFEFETALVAEDDRHDYGEVREVAFGFIGERIHVLVFTMRGETCHVISLRKANRREIRIYVSQN